MSKLTLTLESEVPADDAEELLEAFKPIIAMVIPSPKIHIIINEED